MTELLPCPFCGGGASFGSMFDTIGKKRFVNCVSCEAALGEDCGFACDEDAAEAWNTRAPDLRLEGILREIADGCTPKMHAILRRDDGTMSKNDKCPHGQFIYEQCEQCIEDYARTAIVDTRRMAETGTGSGRSPSGDGAQSAIAQAYISGFQDPRYGLDPKEAWLTSEFRSSLNKQRWREILDRDDEGRSNV